MDVEQVSVVSPYCNAIVIDKDMKDAVNKHEISDKYCVKAYTMKEMDDLETYLKAL